MARHWSVGIALVLLLALTLVSLPLPRGGSNGVYNTISRTMWCRTMSACLHEVGHRLDQEAGWASHSKEFGKAVETYVLVEFWEGKPSDTARAIVNLPGVFSWRGSYFGDSQSEIYAIIFEKAEGQEDKMPEIFRGFYNWERAEALVQKYVR